MSEIEHLPSFDEPYRFGRTPTVAWPYPFTPKQLARLLILRGRARDLHGLRSLLRDRATDTAPLAPPPGD